MQERSLLYASVLEWLLEEPVILMFAKTSTVYSVMMLPRPASKSLFQHTSHVGMTSPLFGVVVHNRGCSAWPQLNVLFVYFIEGVERIGTNKESIMIRLEITTPEKRWKNRIVGVLNVGETH